MATHLHQGWLSVTETVWWCPGDLVARVDQEQAHCPLCGCRMEETGWLTTWAQEAPERPSEPLQEMAGGHGAMKSHSPSQSHT